MFKIIKLLVKDPCKECLVDPICKKGKSFIDCDLYRKYNYKLELYDDRVCKILIILLCGFFSTTFLLGIIKWIEIVIKLF